MRHTFAVILLLAVGSAQAVPVTWTLQDVVFDDGATLTGSFVFDVDSDTVYVQPQHPIQATYYAQAFYFDVNIVTSNSTDPLSDFNVQTPVYAEDYIGPFLQDFYDWDTGQTLPPPPANADPSSYQNGVNLVSEYQDYFVYIGDILRLNYAAPLTNAGGIVAISGYQERQVILNGGGSPYFERYIVSGTLLGVPIVPIPAAVWLFGSALAGLGWIGRKQAA